MVGSKQASSTAPRQLKLPAAWWPVAFAREVEHHPGAFVLGARRLALYRDLSGTVRAVDDLCPHRRMPLSLGRVTEDGYLQCAYHGWCFDGATGQCATIPHLRDDEPVKPNLRVAAFATAEGIAEAVGISLRPNGPAPPVGPASDEDVLAEGMSMLESRISAEVVHVWSGDDAPPHAPAPAGSAGSDRRTFASTMKVRAPYDLLAEALLWNPGRVLGLPLLLGCGDELVRPQVGVDGDGITVRRERLTLAVPRPASYSNFNRGATAVEISMNVVTGSASVRAIDPAGRSGAVVTVALTPISPFLTVVRWRAQVETGRRGGIEQAVSLHRFPARAARLAHATIDDWASHQDASTEALREARAAHIDPTAGDETEE
jgi:nitrite reductase/ring-hydroxylating ferredoxin subunit